MTAMLEVALDYAAGGALVLPLHTPVDNGCSCRRRECTSTGKHPRTMNGFRDASIDITTVERWWRMWPNANVGIRPGEGTFVLDVDPRAGGDVQLAGFQQRYGRLPTTRTASTGGLGLHLWFHGDGDLVGHLAGGVDVKYHEGYVVAAPSLHASGRRYTWINTGPIVDAPDVLMSHLRRPVRPPAVQTGVTSPAVVEGLLRIVRTAEVGNRNSALYWACRRAAEKGIDSTPLIEVAVERGLSRDEAERTADSAGERRSA